MQAERVSERWISKELFVTDLDGESSRIDRRSVFGGTPQSISYGRIPGWFGDCMVATSEHGVCWLDLRPGSDAAGKLQAAFPAAKFRRTDKTTLGKRIFGYSDEPVAVHLSGTEFQLRIWQALLRIPAGRCMSYGQLALCIGAPRGARAVGGAISANKVAVLVPCHRALPASGGIGGFRWGSDLKKALLLREQKAASGPFPEAA